MRLLNKPLAAPVVRSLTDQANLRASLDGGRSYTTARFVPARTTDAQKMRQGSGARALGLGR